MCFDFDSRPPELPRDLALPPIAGGAGAEILTLRSADGTEFSAALAEAPDDAGLGVVILPDVRGLYPFYIELAERFTQAGHAAIAIDYYGRTAGLGPRDDDFDYRAGADRHGGLLLRRQHVVRLRCQSRARTRARRRSLRRSRPLAL
jgi:carboxymethylenebutenolidase